MCTHQIRSTPIGASASLGGLPGPPRASVFGRRAESDSDSDSPLPMPMNSRRSMPAAYNSKRERARPEIVSRRSEPALPVAASSGQDSRQQDSKAAADRDPWWYKLLVPSGTWTASYVTDVDDLPEEMRTQLLGHDAPKKDSTAEGAAGAADSESDSTAEAAAGESTDSPAEAN